MSHSPRKEIEQLKSQVERLERKVESLSNRLEELCWLAIATPSGEIVSMADWQELLWRQRYDDL